MTILPSAIIVNELHIKPFRSGQSRGSSRLGDNTDDTEVVPSQLQNTEANSSATGIITEPKSLVETEEAVQEDVESSPELSIFTGTQLEDTRQDHGSVLTRVTMSSSSSSEEDESHGNEPNEDTNFLNHTDKMTKLDRYFVERYAPNVYRRRKKIVSGFLLCSILLGTLAALFFTLHEGTMVGTASVAYHYCALFHNIVVHSHSHTLHGTQCSRKSTICELLLVLGVTPSNNKYLNYISFYSIPFSGRVQTLIDEYFPVSGRWQEAV